MGKGIYGSCRRQESQETSIAAISAEATQGLRELAAGPLKEPTGKPRLLVLEGPAGAGKTTLLDLILRDLNRRGIRARALSEFSFSPLGCILHNSAALGNGRRAAWMCGLAGLLAFAADRIANLESALVDSNAIYVCDRFVISEVVLALQAIRPSPERVAGTMILAALLSWARVRFASDSIIVLLGSTQLEERLRRRLGRGLNFKLRTELAAERARYLQVSDLDLGWNMHAVSTDAAPPAALAEELVSWAIESWTR